MHSNKEPIDPDELRRSRKRRAKFDIGFGLLGTLLDPFYGIMSVILGVLGLTIDQCPACEKILNKSDLKAGKCTICDTKLTKS